MVMPNENYYFKYYRHSIINIIIINTYIILFWHINQIVQFIGY